MQKFNLNNKALAEQMAILASYATKSSKTDVDEELLEAFSAKLNELADEEVSEEDALAAVFGIAEVITDATETKVDDYIVDGLKAISNATGVSAKITGWLSRIGN